MTQRVATSKERIRAPKENDQAAIAPARTELAELARSNQHRWLTDDVPEWIRAMREHTRRELSGVVEHYSASYLEGNEIPLTVHSGNGPWIVGGHQPELFHPGVWFKNILIDRLARETQGTGMHAIVDHDLAHVPSIRVPRRDSSQRMVHAQMMPLPIQRPITKDPFLPWNAWEIEHARLPSYVSEVEAALRSVGIEQSMLPQFAKLLSESQPVNAAIDFSRARHRVEWRNGIRNREFPMSTLCRTDAWMQFVNLCIDRASDLHPIYNECLRSYREREQITNPVQPVPQLGASSDWIEMPFWIRLPGESHRRRLWVRASRGRWQISPLGDQAQTRCESLASAREAGWEIWPRALMTTLFLRTFVADLFVHGIGGGLYDELTDQIIEEFLGFAPMPYVTCTATLWLSLPQESSLASSEVQRDRSHILRERQLFRSCPERLLDPSKPEEHALALEHRKLLQAQPPRGHRKSWHQSMTRLKSQIVQQVIGVRRQLEDRLALVEAREQEQRTLRSREFSFVLFDEVDVLSRLQALAR